jgi:hypothetical protein
MRQLAAQDVLDRATLLAELLNAYAARHGRPATPVEVLPLENLAAGTIRIRRLEAQGKDSLEERRLLAQWWRAAGLKAEKPAPPSAADRVAALQAALSKPSVADGQGDESK